MPVKKRLGAVRDIIESLAYAALGTPQQDGHLIFDTTNKLLKIGSGGAWALGNGFLTGTGPARTAFTSVIQGLRWFETDTQDEYVHDGTSWRLPGGQKWVAAATTANITLLNTQTIDAVAVNVGDLVLVKNQTDSTQNGVWTVATSAWFRTPGWDLGGPLSMHRTVSVRAGTANGGTVWSHTFKLTDTMGTTPIRWYMALMESYPYASLPTSVKDGQAVFDSTNKILKIADGGAWASPKAVAGAGASFATNPEVGTIQYEQGTSRLFIFDGVLWQVPKADDSVRACSTANIGSLSGQLTIDGVALGALDTVLLKDQTTPSQNGVYQVGGPGVAWNRMKGWNQEYSHTSTRGVRVREGTVNAGSHWTTDFPSSGVLGTTAMKWYPTFVPGGAAATGGLPPGMINPFAGSVAPAGWLLCNGGGYLQSDYPALWAVIGAQYGDPGISGRFLVPDLRGRVPVGVDSTQTEFAALAQVGGEKTHKLTAAESGVPAHDHALNPTTNFTRYVGTGGTNVSGATGASVAFNNVDIAVNAAAAAANAHNNLQPYAAMNYLIKT